MQCAGNHFLAGSAFPRDQNRQVGACRLTNGLEDFLHTFTLANNRGIRVLRAGFLVLVGQG